MRFTFPAPKPPTAHAGRINHRKDSLLIALFLIDTNQPHGQVPSSESRTRPSRHPPGGNDTQETRPRSREARAPEKRLLSFRRRSLPEPILTALPLHTRGAGGSAPRRPLANPDSPPSPRRVPSTLLRDSRRRTLERGAGRLAPSWPSRWPRCPPPPPLAAQAVIMTSSLFLLLPLASEPRTATAAAGGGLVTESSSG